MTPRKSTNKNNGDPFDHAWKYFELHATQRISLIRYFIAFFSLYVTAAGYMLIKFCQPDILEELAVLTLSIIFILLTIIFKLLDARNRDLIHLAEESLRKIEEKNKFDEAECIFKKEMEQTYRNDPVRHSRCFKWIFHIACITSWLLLLFSLLQILNRFSIFSCPFFEILKKSLCH